jgi:hypothetical protein
MKKATLLLLSLITVFSYAQDWGEIDTNYLFSPSLDTVALDSFYYDSYLTSVRNYYPVSVYESEGVYCPGTDLDDAIITIKMLKDYAQECYRDSVEVKVPNYVPNINDWNLRWNFGGMYGYEYKWIHKEPTFNGFIKWFNKKYGYERN